MKIECIEIRTPYKCYTETMYKVTSETPLSCEQLRDLRSSGKLGSGQNIGMLLKDYKEGESFIYLLKTTCDSGG